MSKKRILGIILILGSIAMLLFSRYIMTQVEQGQAQIESAQKKVNQGKELFSLSPYTKDVGQGLTNMGQKKINEGQELADKYANLANLLRIGGFIVFVVGVGLFLLGRNRKH